MAEIVSFGEWVQRRRNVLGLTRKAFADRVGCAPITIKKIERDERKPSLEIAELLAIHLQIAETEQTDFIRRARGEFIPRFGSPDELSLTEAQSPVSQEEAPKHNLPTQTTPFIGRQTELEKVTNQLADSACRLLTILGAGGMGKTRLGVAAAQMQISNFTDGVVYVSLAPIGNDGAETAVSINPIVAALADALKISFQGDSPPEQQLTNYLKRKEMLILFDNFEHLLDTAVFLSNLLQHAPDIKILTTSRERLNLQEEWLFALQGLSFSDDQSMSAVQLFAQRARQVKEDFDLEREKTAVLRICQLVEGMPLGLELAASWVMQLSCEEIADEIESELDFLTTEIRNVPDRHRSIRAIFGYSWERLSAKEQDVLQKLSVFRGGFERKAAKAVTGASLPLLARLVGKSLLSVGENGRYTIHELLRQFAAEKLAENSLIVEETHRQHCYYFLAFLSDLHPTIYIRQNRASFLLLEQEMGNVRAALPQAIAHHNHLFTKLVGQVLWVFFDVQGGLLESNTFFSAITQVLKQNCIPHHGIDEQRTVHPACLRWISYIIFWAFSQGHLGRHQSVEEVLQQCLLILPESDPVAQPARGSCYWMLGYNASANSDYVHAQQWMDRSISLLKATDDIVMYGSALWGSGQIAYHLGDYKKAAYFAKESLQIFSTIGNELWRAASLRDLGWLALIRGDFAEAEAKYREVLIIQQRFNHKANTPYSYNMLGIFACIQGKREEARTYLRQCIDMANELNMIYPAAQSKWYLGNLAVMEGDYQTAKYYYRESGLLKNRTIDSGGIGWAHLGLGELEEAAEAFQGSLQIMFDIGTLPIGLDSLTGLAHIEAQKGHLSHALELLALIRHHSASSWEIREKGRLLWEELVAELSPELVVEAETRGRELDLFKTAATLLEGERSI